MKRVLALCLAVMMCLGCLCAAAEETTYKVGVIQVVTHVALDSARDGFVQALKDNGLEEGKNLTLRLENGQGEVTNMSTIADQFVSDQMDLVLAIGTGAAQTMAGKTTEIPILGTAITDYVVARLVDSNEQPGGNVSGTTDINPVAEQIGLIKQFVPDAQTVGVFYTASEDNSVLQAQMAKEAIEAAGMTYVETTIINSNDVQQAAQELPFYHQPHIVAHVKCLVEFFHASTADRDDHIIPVHTVLHILRKCITACRKRIRLVNRLHRIASEHKCNCHKHRNQCHKHTKLLHVL